MLKNKWVVAMLAALSSQSFAAPACLDPGATGGIGGTGHTIQSPGGGIGGTGNIASNKSGNTGGIGGTGHGAEPDNAVRTVGIVGTITGFGSVCVNGLRVHYDDSTPIDENGTTVTASTLAVGQVIAIQAGAGKNGLTANKVAIVHPLVGPVTHVDPVGKQLHVMGQPVRLGNNLDPEILARIRPGQALQVSGLRDPAGKVVASRLVDAPPGRSASVIGIMQATAIEGIPLAPDNQRNASANTGETKMLTGTWTGNAFKANTVKEDPVNHVIRGADRIVLEARIASDGPNTLRVNGYQVKINKAQFVGGTSKDVEDDRTVRITGRLENPRSISADKLEFEKPDQNDAYKAEQHNRQSSREEEKDNKEAGFGNDKTSEVKESDSERSRELARAEQKALEAKEKAAADYKSEKMEKLEKSAKADKVEKVDKPEKADKPDKPDRPDKPDKPDKPDRPDKPDKPDRPDRRDRIDR